VEVAGSAGEVQRGLKGVCDVAEGLADPEALDEYALKDLAAAHRREGS
jgi:hypothetical protein